MEWRVALQARRDSPELRNVWRNLWGVTPAGSGCCSRCTRERSSATLTTGPTTRLAMLSLSRRPAVPYGGGHAALGKAGPDARHDEN